MQVNIPNLVRDNPKRICSPQLRNMLSLYSGCFLHYLDEHSERAHWYRKDDIQYNIELGTLHQPQISRTVILFTGSHTYGTVAAKFFAEDFHPHLRKLTQNKHRNFAVLISAHIVDGYPTKMKLEQSYSW